MEPLVAPVRSWPAPWQEDLLEAAIGPADGVCDAWDRMLAGRAVSDIHDGAARRVLPVVAERLQAVAPDHPDLGELRAMRRQAWIANVEIIHRCAPHVAALADAGFEPLILKGLPLAVDYYDDLSLRPMSDLDVLVPDDRFDEGLALLAARGLRPEYDLAATRSFSHGVGLFDTDGRASLDLHFTIDRWIRTGPAVWAAAEPFRVPGIDSSELHAPDPTMMFTHCCVHGVRTTTTVNLRWICDAARILDRRGDEIDWDLVASSCDAGPGVLLLRDACRYLADRFDLPVPEELLHTLEARPVGVGDRLVHRVAVGRDPAERSGKLMVTASTWARSRSGQGFWRSLRELPRFLVSHWNLDSPREIPRFAAARIGRSLRRTSAQPPAAATVASRRGGADGRTATGSDPS